eukprot:111727-Rhodomonas_salina.2
MRASISTRKTIRSPAGMSRPMVMVREGVVSSQLELIVVSGVKACAKKPGSTQVMLSFVDKDISVTKAKVNVVRPPARASLTNSIVVSSKAPIACLYL